jgi:hypothetical protein
LAALQGLYKASRAKMKYDTKYLRRVGHCFAIGNSGPFVIGKDFEPPGPAGRKISRIKIDRKKWNELWAFVESGAAPKIDDDSDASIFEYAAESLDFENGINEALNWYISDIQYQADLPRFRKQLQKLCNAVEQFASQLPEEITPLGHFLFQTYTGEVMLSDRLKPSEQQLMALQDAWRDRVGITAIKETLKTMHYNIQAAQSLVGNKKPRKHHVTTFVQTLAIVWNSATGHWPKSGRDPNAGNQSGPFAAFVRATNDILPKHLRIANLDRAIRAVCERPNGA